MHTKTTPGPVLRDHPQKGVIILNNNQGLLMENKYQLPFRGQSRLVGTGVIRKGT
jgi:hypothetical protein